MNMHCNTFIGLLSGLGSDRRVHPAQLSSHSSTDYCRFIAGVDAAELERACSAIDALARAETCLDANVNTAVVLQQLSIALTQPARAAS